MKSSCDTTETISSPKYRHIATSIDGFIQQLAVAYVARGYWFYVVGRVPPGKDAEAIDRKLMKRYGVSLSRWQRARRKRAGLANVHYLRHGHIFVLLSTAGAHEFFDREKVRDCRRTPIRVFGYSVSYRNGKASVRIDLKQLKVLKAHLLDVALTRDVFALERTLRGLPFAPYGPVRSQLVGLWRAVSRKRCEAGLEPLSKFCLRLWRRQVRVFD